MTRKVLFAWERGSAYGHLMRDLPIADSLRDAGCQVLFVVRDVRVAAELLLERGHHFVASPTSDLSPFAGRPPRTYADRLYRQGYSDELTLLGMTEAWIQTISLLSPDILFANYAPTAMLAADILGIQQYLAGTGWEVPPPVSPSPSLDLDAPPPDHDPHAGEKEVCETVNRVLARYKAPPMSSIADLLRGKPTSVTTYPELDHYGRFFERSGYARPTDQYVGHVACGAVFEGTAWSAPRRPKKVLAYLRPGESMPALLAALGELSRTCAEVICVMPGSTERDRHAAGADVRFYDRGIRFDNILGESDLLINYAGAGTVCAALLEGVPLFLVPDTLERSVTAERVAKLGAGITANPHDQAKTLSRAIVAQLEDAAFTRAAEGFAANYRTTRQDDPAATIARRVLALI